jgi:hypothetical protein
MTEKKPLQEPANTKTTNCNITILGIKRTILKITPHYQKRNKEFRNSRKQKIKENLDKYLLDDEIIKEFVRQLHEKEPEDEGVNKD